MNLRFPRIDVELARMPVGEAAADADDQVGFQESLVTDRLSYLNAGMAGA